MNSAPFSFDLFYTFGLISLFLLLGTYLRAKFVFFQKSMVTSCIIGGILGFLFLNFGWLDIGAFSADQGLIKKIVYHLFNLTFICLGLINVKSSKGAVGAMRGGFWYCGVMLTCAGFAAAAGIISILCLNLFASGDGFIPSLGSLTALGFGGGPGQALAAAKAWEATLGVTGYSDFGLAGSAVGELVVFLIALPYIAFLIKKNRSRKKHIVDTSVVKGYYSEKKMPQAGKVATSSANIDGLAFHLAIVLGIYTLCFLTYYALETVVPLLLEGKGATKFLRISWTMFYAVGLCYAIIVKKIMNKCGIGYMLNPSLNSRISGLLIDYLAVGAIMSIEVGKVAALLSPLLISALACTITVFAICYFYCSRRKEHGLEHFAMLVGHQTGTSATGLILLRIVDPEHATPTAINLGLGTSFGTPVLVGYMTLIVAEVVMGWGIFSVIAGFVAVGIVGVVLERMANLRSQGTRWGKEIGVQKAQEAVAE